jgi:hypothetical protein
MVTLSSLASRSIVAPYSRTYYDCDLRSSARGCGLHRPREARIADYIRAKNRCKFPGLSNRASPRTRLAQRREPRSHVLLTEAKLFPAKLTWSSECPEMTFLQYFSSTTQSGIWLAGGTRGTLGTFSFKADFARGRPALGDVAGCADFIHALPINTGGSCSRRRPVIA